MLYEEQKSRIEDRFPRFFLKEFEKLSEESAKTAHFLDIFCIEKNTEKLYSRKNYYTAGGIFFREIREGGIFAALWEICEDVKAEAAGKPHTAGCTVDLQKIPVDQHVVEILELFKESPYEVSSRGSWLIAGDLSDQQKEESCAVCIGEVTDRPDRIIRIGENRRYLSPAQRQQKDIENRRRGNEKEKQIKETTL